MTGAAPRICLVQASGQNAFFAEMLEAIGEALRGAGVRVETAFDFFPAPAEDLVFLFVPHEYQPLTFPDAHPTPAHLERSIALCTEQPGTIWFDQAAEIAKRAGAAIDINDLGVAELRRQGVDARYMRLGYVPSWDRWGGDESAERPIDLTFMGGHTDRRAAALARCAPVLVGRRASLHVFETTVPHTEASVHFLRGDRKWDVLRRSKVILNVHRSPLAYVEWQRLAGAIANGCVVLTEHSTGFGPLVPGEHFVSAGYDALADALDALLRDEDRLRAMRTAAYDLLRNKMPLSGSIAAVVEAAGEIAARPLGPLPTRLYEIPLPKPAVAPPTPFEVEATRTDDLAIIRGALKDVATQQRRLRRTVDRLVHGGQERPEVTVTTAGPRLERPSVSVVLTVFNYADVVGQAIRSVAASEAEDVELVVVDDASTDGSVEAVERALAQAPWLSAKLVRRGHNGGLGAARNTGIEHAGAELVFILDADNLVYPHGLARMAGALEADPDAAFAYGMLERFSVVAGPDGLLSWLGWSAARLRHGNFIDAQALLRRDAVLAAGGFTTDDVLHGWEDFDLWCALADQGRYGVLVPEILGRYRAAPHSMITATNVDARAAWTVLLERHPVLRG